MAGSQTRFRPCSLYRASCEADFKFDGLQSQMVHALRFCLTKLVPEAIALHPCQSDCKAFMRQVSVEERETLFSFRLTSLL